MTEARISEHAARIAAQAPPLNPEQIDSLRQALGSTRPAAAGSSPTIGNPFGRWTKHRSDLANLMRREGETEDEEAHLRQLINASRLADKIIAERDHLTADQRATLRALI